MSKLRNGSQVTTRPTRKATAGTAGYFAESNDNGEPSYPGQDWFNDVIDEIVQAVAAAGVTYDPTKITNLKSTVEALRNASNLNAGTVLLAHLPVTSGPTDVAQGKLLKVEERNFTTSFSVTLPESVTRRYMDIELPSVSRSLIVKVLAIAKQGQQLSTGGFEGVYVLSRTGALSVDTLYCSEVTGASRIGLAEPIIDGNIVHFGLRRGNNGTSTNASVHFKVEVLCESRSDFNLTYSDGSVSHSYVEHSNKILHSGNTGNAAFATLSTSSTDTVSGRISTVGSQLNTKGYHSVIDANLLQDSLPRGASFHIMITASTLNRPGGTESLMGTSYISALGDYGLVMVQGDSTPSKLYIRSRNGGVWGDWLPVFTSASVAVSADVLAGISDSKPVTPKSLKDAGYGTGFGKNHTYIDRSSYVLGTVLTNTSAAIRFISVTVSGTTSGNSYIEVDGDEKARGNVGSSGDNQMTAIIPPGAEYSVKATAGGAISVFKEFTL